MDYVVSRHARIPGPWIDNSLAPFESCLTCVCAVWPMLRFLGIGHRDTIGGTQLCRDQVRRLLDQRDRMSLIACRLPNPGALTYLWYFVTECRASVPHVSIYTEILMQERQFICIASQERHCEEDKQQFDHLDVTDGFAISPAIGACSPSSGQCASSCVKPRMMLLDLSDGHSGRSTEVLVFRLI